MHTEKGNYQNNATCTILSLYSSRQKTVDDKGPISSYLRVKNDTRKRNTKWTITIVSTQQHSRSTLVCHRL